MRAALEGLTRPDGTRPLLIAVTQLTSTDAAARAADRHPHGETVLSYAKNAAATVDGVVCSPLEAALVKERCGADFLTVTPGIRFADSAAGDQKRVIYSGEGGQVWLRLHRGPSHHPGGRPGVRLSESGQGFRAERNGAQSA